MGGTRADLEHHLCRSGAACDAMSPTDAQAAAKGGGVGHSSLGVAADNSFCKVLEGSGSKLEARVRSEGPQLPRQIPVANDAVSKKSMEVGGDPVARITLAPARCPARWAVSWG